MKILLVSHIHKVRQTVRNIKLKKIIELRRHTAKRAVGSTWPQSRGPPLSSQWRGLEGSLRDSWLDGTSAVGRSPRPMSAGRLHWARLYRGLCRHMSLGSPSLRSPLCLFRPQTSGPLLRSEKQTGEKGKDRGERVLTASEKDFPPILVLTPPAPSGSCWQQSRRPPQVRGSTQPESGFLPWPAQVLIFSYPQSQ